MTRDEEFIIGVLPTRPNIAIGTLISDNPMLCVQPYYP